MVLSTFRSELMTQVNRRDLSTTLANQFIRDGIARLNEELRARCMQATVSADPGVDGGYPSIPLPADYLETIRVLADDRDDEVPVVPYPRLLRYSAEMGTPAVYAHRAGTLYVRPYAQSSLTLDYYAKVGALSADGDTNVVLENHPHVLRYAALVFAAEHFGMTDKLAMWDAHYQAVRDALNVQAQDADYSGGTMQVSPIYGGRYA